MNALMFFRVLVLVCASVSCLLAGGCRRSAPQTMSLDYLVSSSCYIVTAKPIWRSSTELTLVAQEAFPLLSGTRILLAPKPGESVDVIEFREKPSRLPESFVVFFRSCDGSAQIIMTVPVYDDRMASVLDIDGHEVEASKWLEKLKRGGARGAKP
jgi:hypothetical protein